MSQPPNGPMREGTAESATGAGTPSIAMMQNRARQMQRAASQSSGVGSPSPTLGATMTQDRLQQILINQRAQQQQQQQQLHQHQQHQQQQLQQQQQLLLNAVGRGAGAAAAPAASMSPQVAAMIANLTNQGVGKAINPVAAAAAAGTLNVNSPMLIPSLQQSALMHREMAVRAQHLLQQPGVTEIIRQQAQRAYQEHVAQFQFYQQRILEIQNMSRAGAASFAMGGAQPSMAVSPQPPMAADATATLAQSLAGAVAPPATTAATGMSAASTNASTATTPTATTALSAATPKGTNATATAASSAPSATTTSATNTPATTPAPTPTPAPTKPARTPSSKGKKAAAAAQASASQVSKIKPAPPLAPSSAAPAGRAGSTGPGTQASNFTFALEGNAGGKANAPARGAAGGSAKAAPGMQRSGSIGGGAGIALPRIVPNSTSGIDHPTGAAASSTATTTASAPSNIAPAPVPPTVKTLDLGARTLSGGSAGGLTSLGAGPPTGNDATSAAMAAILPKRKLQELTSQVDPNERLDPEVEDILLEVADEFIESVTAFACRLAKHRKSDTLEVKDLQLHLERNWNIRIPGFAAEDPRPIKKATNVDVHRQRLAAIQALRQSRRAAD